jgi:hypothetical protein
MKSNWLLCLAAGIAGGLISHFAWSPPVHAQSGAVLGGPAAPPQVYTASPVEVHAQEFILVDSKGQQEASIKTGTFQGTNVVEIVNSAGQVVFTAGSSMARTLAVR